MRYWSNSVSSGIQVFTRWVTGVCKIIHEVRFFTKVIDRIMRRVELSPLQGPKWSKQTSHMPSPSVEVTNLKCRYLTRETEALHDISLVAYPGQIILISGASGCGKS